LLESCRGRHSQEDDIYAGLSTTSTDTDYGSVTNNTNNTPPWSQYASTDCICETVSFETVDS